MSLSPLIQLSLTMALGLVIAMMLTIPQDRAQRLAVRLEYVHGAAGLLGVLTLALSGANPAYGQTPVMIVAFAAALAMGIGMFVAGRRGKPASPIVITLHAGAAAIGCGMLTGAI